MEYQILSENDFNAMKDICYASPVEDSNLYDNTEYIYEDLHEYVNLDDEYGITNLIKECSNIPVYTKNYLRLPINFIKEHIEEYVEDNWFMEWPYDYLEGYELMEKFEQDFNRAQTWYVSGPLIGYLDMSKEVENYIKEMQKDNTCL